MRRNFNEGTGYQNALRDRKISLESEQPEEILKVNINQYWLGNHLYTGDNCGYECMSSPNV